MAAPPSGYHWVDAAGAAVTVGTLLEWIDPNTGFRWAIDPDTGRHDSLIPQSEPIFYLDEQCTLGERVIALPADTPFRHDAAGPLLVVRPDGVPSAEACVESARTLAGGCSVLPWCIFDRFIEARDLVTVGIGIPASPWVGPLHLER